MKLELIIIFVVEFLVVMGIAFTMSMISGYFWYCCQMLTLEDAVWHLFLFLVPFLIAIQYIVGATFAIMGDD